MDIGALMRRLPAPVRKAIVAIINKVGPVRRLVSRLAINKKAYAAPPRPRAVSMAAEYTTWRGLTDRRYSGRHLPPCDGDAAPKQPPIEDVLALFKRKTFRPATDTSLIFAFFAQWFVDSFLRTKWEEGDNRSFRENESNHEIDLCQIYGVGEVQTTMLREKKGGRLMTRQQGGESWPPPLFEERDGKLDLADNYRPTPSSGEDDPGLPGLYTMANFRRVYDERWTEDDRRNAFAAGLEHGSSTLGNSIMNTLFLREHNRTAGILEKAHPDWDDERLFQTARNVTIVVLLNIVISDYIVHISPVDIRVEAVPGMAEKERWYRNNWMAVEFALLYRWHDLIPDEFTVAGKSYPGKQLVRANRLLMESGLDQILLDAGRQRAGRIGLGNTADFLLPVKKLSIEMARTCKLPALNRYREYYGLKPVRSFEALTRDKAMASELRALYGDVERLEWFVGLFAEGYDDEGMMGELLITMVANDAFTQALTNPLLSKAVYNDKTFGREGLEIIESTRTLTQVIARNTGIAEPVGFTVSEPAAVH
ncbi:MAG TPA: peroxidase family protein [Allosphingosinicella sp.]|nr:peroxidase family protein [Allosphingosinicella sp.]